MAVLGVLIDPSNPEGSWNIYNMITKYRHDLEDKCEYWVGCTKSSAQGLTEWLRRLKNAGIENRVCFPGKPSHAYSARYANYLFRPDLLNANSLAKLTVWYGKHLSDKLYGKETEPIFWDYGYLVLYHNSTAGRKIGAKDIDNKTAFKLCKNFLSKSVCMGIYIEAGSGYKISVADRLELLKKIAEIKGDKKMISGGGITELKHIIRLREAGVDKIIVGTYFEKHAEDLLEFVSVL